MKKTVKDFPENVGVNDESRIRHKAKRTGFTVLRTRGLESRRREASGIGTFMLLSQDGVTLPHATLGDIAEFLQAHDQAQKRQLH